MDISTDCTSQSATILVTSVMLLSMVHLLLFSRLSAIHVLLSQTPFHMQRLIAALFLLQESFKALYEDDYYFFGCIFV